MNAPLAGLLLSMVLLTGCQTAEPARDYRPTWARFFLESGDESGTEIVLPQSRVRLVVNAKPVLTEGDIVAVELAQVDLGRCLMFQLTPAAVRDFYRLSGSNQGRRLVLLLNDSPVGARRVDGPVTDGVVFVFVEIPDAELPKLVDDLKKSTAAFQRALARKS
ncbi:MAG: hypothetical protein HY736_04740 [Verrucomicrobia bacterium]|nr:hypothetical protein [Verrucomicrobiota bacterium]